MKKHRDLELSNKAFSQMESNYHTKWIDLERLYKSKHKKKYIELAKKYERSHIFVPLAKSTIDILDAIFTEAFFSSGNPIEITKNEEKESEIASCLNVLVDHYYKLSKPYSALSMAFSSASRFGLGAVLPFWDNNKKIPVTRFVPATKIAFDTEALTRDEIQYVSYKFKQTKQDIHQKVKDGFYAKVKEKDLNTILGSQYKKEKEKYKRIDVVEVYSLQTNGKYKVRTFIKERLMREVEFKKCPIKHGFLTAVLPTIDENIQDNQSAGVGESMLDIMQNIVQELNQKRNQIIDINEQLIDPYTMVGDNADVDPDDAGRIKGVVNVGDPEKVKRFPPTTSFPIEKEVAVLKEDLNDLTAINGMQRGETSVSDRRGASAMAMINANSSSRLSKMATTINDTLFQEWAEAFVYDIYVNAPDEVINNLYGSNPFGTLGNRQELDYVVNINFGQSINRDAKVSELTMLLQMLNGREDADVMPILGEVLKLILGDAFDTKILFPGVLQDQGTQSTDGRVPAAESQTAGGSEQDIAGGAATGFSSAGTGRGNIESAEPNTAAGNKI